MKKKLLIIAGSLLGIFGLMVAAVAIVWFGFKGTAISLLLGLPGPKNRTIVERNVMATMRDGVKLAADVYRPDVDGKVPVIISRLPTENRIPTSFKKRLGICSAGRDLPMSHRM